MTPPDGPVVLVVEDEPAPLRVIEASLAAHGFRVVTATTGARAVELVSQDSPDVMVVDLGLPDMDGLVLCRNLRLWTKSPIIVVTADGSEERMVQALDEGADDYVTKPFSMPELLARIRVASRHRSTLPSRSEDPVIVVGSLSIDGDPQRARLDVHPLDLDPKQLKLLTLLARNAGRILTYRQLTLHLWGPDTQASSAHELRLLVTSLRAALGDAPGAPRITAERQVGYRMSEPDHRD